MDPGAVNFFVIAYTGASSTEYYSMLIPASADNVQLSYGHEDDTAVELVGCHAKRYIARNSPQGLILK